MNTRADFDVGPLSWVKGEIDLAMQRGLESLHAFAANPRDDTRIKLAQTHLHQALGALRIVGLDGVTRVSEELEALLADLEKELSARAPQNFELAEEAFGAVQGYLDSLINGSSNQPLRLFPLYRRLLAARGRHDADPVDLYFPDLSGRPPSRDTTPVGRVPEGQDRQFREQRGLYQRGLLKWTKGDAGGAEDMRAAVEATELVQAEASQRVFWWVALALFDALVADALPEGVDAKRLCYRIDQQFRRLVEGSQNVAERLLRETLYQVALAQPATPHIRAVQQACRLEHTLPKDDGVQPPAIESAALKPAREALTHAKDAWDKFASGDPPSLIAFRSASGVLNDRTAELGNPDAAALARELAVLATWLSSNTPKMSEAISLEVATALLLLENALANVGSLGADFTQQSQFVCARLKACVLGKLLRTPPTIPLLDEMSRKAQERLVLSQVVTEIQANLRSIEQVLDAFFRDPAKRGDLTLLGDPLHQVRGALDMLGETRARDSLGECEAEIRRFAHADYAPHQEDFERIAQILAGLGFYIEALAVGKADFDVAMNPIPAKRPAEELVAIGEERVSKSQFDIFASEAASHLQTMAQERELLSQQAVITDALMRAAHALTGICATVRLDAVRDLGYALEQALQRLSATTPSEAEDRLIGEAIGALSTMVGEARLRHQPPGRTDLVERLRRAGIPPLVQCAASVLLPEEEGALSREPEAVPAPPAAAAPIAPPLAEAVREPVSPPGALVPEEIPIERRQPRMRDELDPQLLPLFLEEASELMPAVSGALRNWRANPGETGMGPSLQRLLHTLKGGARMAGAMGIGELTHHMETRVEDALSLKTRPETLFDALDASYDRLGILLEEVRTGTVIEPSGAPPPRAAMAATAQEIPHPAAMLRVRAEMVDQLVNQAGEASIAHSRIEGEMRSLRTAIEELADNVVRLRSQLREIEIQAESQMQPRMQEIRDAKQGFDPLDLERYPRFQELTRRMAESVSDVQTVHQNLIRAADEAEAGLLAQAHLHRDLQRNLMRVRMVPFSSLSERFYRIVRQTAKELGRRVNLDIRGAQVDLDRSVLERITAPFEHLLRNAITHGIESPAERRAKGKPEIGEIRLEITQQGNDVLLTLADDGQGLDLSRIRDRAIALGLLGERVALSDAELADFIFLPGFTTATVVSEIAGRGVGMNVVGTEVAALGGRIELEFQKDRGTRFTICLPLALGVTQAVPW